MKNNILMVILIGLFIGCGGEKIDVTVMTPTIQCGMCERNIEVGLSKVDGVASSAVDLSTKTTKVSFDAQKTDVLKIERAISNLGYQANETLANSEAYESLPACCKICLLYTSPSPRDRQKSRMPSSA